jgi:hypothetical protein
LPLDLQCKRLQDGTLEHVGKCTLLSHLCIESEEGSVACDEDGIRNLPPSSLLCQAPALGACTLLQSVSISQGPNVKYKADEEDEFSLEWVAGQLLPGKPHLREVSFAPACSAAVHSSVSLHREHTGHATHQPAVFCSTSTAAAMSWLLQQQP